jgi:hypothetical protein
MLSSIVPVLGRSSAAQAMNGDPVLVGQAHTELHQTKITNNSAFTGDNANNRTLWLESTNGSALVARSPHLGVDAAASDTSSGVAVIGRVGPIETAEGPVPTGVYGITSSEAAGFGVRGASPSGTGVQGVSESGYALGALGRLDFSTSGLAWVAPGASSTVVSVRFDLVADSKIIVTLDSNQAGLGIQRIRKDPANNRFTVYLNTTVGLHRSYAEVAWLVVG